MLDVRFFGAAGGEAFEDVAALPTKQLQRVAFWWMKKLRKLPDLGHPLEYQASTGDLRSCHKLYFEEDDEPWNPLWEPPRRPPGDPRPRYRIVYRLLPSPAAPELIEIVAVGRKPEVYWRASDRIGDVDDDAESSG